MNLIIGPLNYTVKAFGPTDTEADGRWGLCDRANQMIYLDPSMPPCRQASVLLHEVAHAAWEAFGFPAKADEETVAEFVGSTLGTVFRQNPQLMAVVEAAWREGEAVVS